MPLSSWQLESNEYGQWLVYEYLPYEDHRNVRVVLPISPALRYHPAVWGHSYGLLSQ